MEPFSIFSILGAHQPKLTSRDHQAGRRLQPLPHLPAPLPRRLERRILVSCLRPAQREDGRQGPRNRGSEGGCGGDGGVRVLSGVLLLQGLSRWNQGGGVIWDGTGKGLGWDMMGLEVAWVVSGREVAVESSSLTRMRPSRASGGG